MSRGGNKERISINVKSKEQMKAMKKSKQSRLRPPWATAVAFFFYPYMSFIERLDEDMLNALFFIAGLIIIFTAPLIIIGLLTEAGDPGVSSCQIEEGIPYTTEDGRLERCEFRK